MRDRLIELLKQIDFDYGEECVCASENGYKCKPNLAEFFADALLAAGVIVLPCNVGDTVYWYNMGGKLVEAKVHNEKIIAEIDGGLEYDIPHKEIGKTVFLTREEAEKKLREGE